LEQEGRIAPAFLLYVNGPAVQVKYVAEGYFVKYPRFQPLAEKLGRALRQADVFIHVKGVDTLPVQVRAGQGFQEFILGSGSRKDHVDRLFLFQQLSYVRRCHCGCLLSKFCFVVIDPDM
jgi:hypothetical protein